MVIVVARPEVHRMPTLNTNLSYLTQIEVDKLLAVVGSHSIRDTAIWTTAYWRGLRASEVGMLLWEDWRQDSNRLFVRRLKGSNSGEYMLSPAEITALRAWSKVRGSTPGPLFPSQRGSGRLSRQRLHNLMKYYCGQCGIVPPKDHFHVLRHSIAVHMADKGMDVAVIQDWLGHRDITSTMVYVRITNVSRARAAQMMYEQPKPTTAADAKPAKAAKVRVKWAKDKR